MQKAIAITLIFILGIVACTPQEAQTEIRIGYLPLVVNLPLFVAIEEGYFAQQGINVTLIEAQSPNQVVQAIVTNDLDGAGVLAYPVVFAAETEYPGKLKMFASVDETEDEYVASILVPAASEIKSANDLRGKRIGVYSGLTQVVFLKGILIGMGIDAEHDVDIVEIAPRLQLDGLIAGQYDALSTVEPYTSIALERGIARVLVQNPRVTYIQNPFPSAAPILSSTFIENHPQEAHAYMRAYDDAIAFIKANPTRAKEHLAKYTPISLQTAKLVTLPRFVDLWNDENYAIQAHADWLYEHRLLQAPVNASALFIQASP